MPDHASAATVAYPEYTLKPLKEVPPTFVTNTAFDPTKEKTYKFLSDILDEVVAIFPSKIIHLGGDVQMYFSNRMSDIVSKKGRRMMGCNEICGHDVNNDGGGTAGGKLDPKPLFNSGKEALNWQKNPLKEDMM